MPKLKFRLALLVILIVVLSVYFARNILHNHWLNVVGNIKINIDNFSYEMGGQERSKPISTLEKESRLTAFIGEPFNGFDYSDWQGFWRIIYGIYPESAEPGKLAKRRQLTREQIELRLINDYPMPFSYFTDQHWAEFWKIIK
ncbi:MAG: hypothetical protein AB1755_04890 [Candidatus Omnitrophota bacterium]